MPPGRPKKPTALKILEGNRSKVRTADLRAEPQFDGMPRPPAHLGAVEQGLWRDIVACLPVGLLCRADESVLERFAAAWARWRYCQSKIDEIGVLVASPYGPVVNPLIKVQMLAAKELGAATSELGLSPAARARLVAPEGGDRDPMALLLGDDMDPNGAWSTGRRQ